MAFPLLKSLSTACVLNETKIATHVFDMQGTIMRLLREHLLNMVHTFARQDDLYFPDKNYKHDQAIKNLTSPDYDEMAALRRDDRLFRTINTLVVEAVQTALKQFQDSEQPNYVSSFEDDYSNHNGHKEKAAIVMAHNATDHFSKADILKLRFVDTFQMTLYHEIIRAIRESTPKPTKRTNFDKHGERLAQAFEQGLNSPETQHELNDLCGSLMHEIAHLHQIKKMKDPNKAYNPDTEKNALGVPFSQHQARSTHYYAQYNEIDAYAVGTASELLLKHNAKDKKVDVPQLTREADHFFYVKYAKSAPHNEIQHIHRRFIRTLVNNLNHHNEQVN